MCISFGLSNNNKWGWWIRFTGCLYKRACGSSWLAWSKGRLPAGIVLYSSREPNELSQFLAPMTVLETLSLVLLLLLKSTHTYIQDQQYAVDSD